MDSSSVEYIVRQLLIQLPGLLVAFLGVVLSLVFIRRHKLPSILALLGSLTIIISTVIFTIVQTYFFTARLSSSTLSTQAYVQLTTIVGWIASIVRAFALALLVIAIFVGRKGTTTSSV
jgi:hypothetical protein